MALTPQEKIQLQATPSALHRYKPVHGHNWAEPLDYVANLRSDTSAVITKYYHGLQDEFRFSAAHAIASSWQGSTMQLPDRTYLYAWLENAFWQDYKNLNNGVPCEFSTNKSVLSRWLREQPTLMRDFAEIAARAFSNSGVPPDNKNDLTKTVLELTVPRQFRRQGLYRQLVALAPNALQEAARHVSERDCVLLMGDLPCKVAASLSNKWETLYPGSVIAPTINGALTTMQTLELYDASMLRTALGLELVAEEMQLPLPQESVIASNGMFSLS